MLLPITTSKVLLSGFSLLSQPSEINRIDALPKHDVHKLDLISGFGIASLGHVYQAFAFKLPHNVYFEIINSGVPFTITADFVFPAVEGIISASLLSWYNFFQKTNTFGDDLKKVAKYLYDGFFRSTPYFMDLTFRW